MPNLLTSITMAHWAIVLVYLFMLDKFGLDWSKFDWWIMVSLLFAFETNLGMYVKHSIIQSLENEEDDKDA